MVDSDSKGESTAPPSRRRVSVVTGANIGIGLETAVGLASFGDRVIIACRNAQKAEAACSEIRRRAFTDDVDVVSLDLSSFESIRAAADRISQLTDHIDVLVNNAGLVLSERDSTTEGIEMTFGVNHVGPFLLTTSLRGLLEGARIVNLSSLAHWRALRGIPLPEVIDPPRYHGLLAYGRSKLANLLFTVELADRWADLGVVANAVHPGLVKTGFALDGDVQGFMSRLISSSLYSPFMISAQRGADTPVWLATSDAVRGRTGGYWYKRSPSRVSPKGKDRAAAAALWSFTEELIAARS